MTDTTSRSADADTEAAELAEIVQLLMDLVGHLRGHFDRTAAAVGLTPPMAKALRHLDAPLNMRELARRLKVDASYITSVVDALEEEGLVDRSVNPADRRVKHLVLTPKGRARHRDLLDELYTDVPGLSALADDRRRGLRDLLVEVLAEA